MTADAAGILAETGKKLRILVHDIRPPALERSGLVPALESLCARNEALFGKEIPFIAAGLLPRLTDDATLHAYRIAQEAITNAGKHSHGQHITIRLVKQPHRMILTVKDDGRGIPARRRGGTGLGLQVMQYRANLINAELTIARGPGGGTLVTCVLPTPKPQRRSS